MDDSRISEVKFIIPKAKKVLFHSFELGACTHSVTRYCSNCKVRTAVYTAGLYSLGRVTSTRSFDSSCKYREFVESYLLLGFPCTYEYLSNL